MNLYSDILWIVLLFSMGFLLCGVIPAVGRQTVLRLLTGLALAFLFFLVPAGPVKLVGHLKGLQFEPSLGTMVIFVGLVCVRLDQSMVNIGTVAFHNLKQELNGLIAAILLMSCAIYPMALGLGNFDPYAFGYQSWTIAAAAFVAWFLVWFEKFELIALWFVLAVFACLIELGESDNLFDYLLDPIALTAALVWLIGWLGRKLLMQIGARTRTGQQTDD